ncbi:MAG: 50S ribosomal protein L10 [Parcubacteria group bacterium]|nr:50S ribosomal protein L10 [Parcubacteria group bacterium]
MAKSKQQKEEIVAQLTDKLNKAKSVVLTNYQGLTVSEVQELRQQMKEQAVDYHIVKNTLLKVSWDQSALKGVELAKQDGPVAVAIGYEDEVAPAKLCWEYAKSHKSLEVGSGVLENKLLTKEEIEALAKLPSRDELIAKTVGTIKAPLTGFVNVLAGNLRGLVGVLNAIKEDKESAA